MTMIHVRPEKEPRDRNVHETHALLYEIVGKDTNHVFQQIVNYSYNDSLFQLMHHPRPNHYDDEWFDAYEIEIDYECSHISTHRGWWIIEFIESDMAIKTAH